MKVIIGAGPAGLYLAIKLRKKGIKDIVIYDPRQGIYTRPGHLNESAFRRAEKRINKSFWSKDIGHIKDFERQLYEEVKRLNIKIESKQFVDLVDDKKSPGVIVEDIEGISEIVEADYVFDCTGSSRVVLNAVNNMSTTPPFTLKSIGDVPETHHFLAYVYMDKNDLMLINSISQDREKFLQSQSPKKYAKLMVGFHELGWKEMYFPRCYGVPFGKGKVCLYMQAPEKLESGQYDDWVQIVLDSREAGLQYKHLPPSKKYEKKPRFLPFISHNKMLTNVSYYREGLPKVIAIGDAQIDPDYYLAHGIYNGMDRIDALLESMDIFDGHIWTYCEEDYNYSLNELLREHQQDVIEEGEQQKKQAIDALMLAKGKLQDAIPLYEGSMRNTLELMLARVKVRILFVEIHELFDDIHYHPSGNLKTDCKHPESLHTNLTKIDQGICAVIKALPPEYALEHSIAKTMFLQLGGSWKALGNAFYKQKQWELAIEAYRHSLAVYQSGEMTSLSQSSEVPLWSNLSIVYYNNKDFMGAIEAGKNAVNRVLSLANTPEAVPPNLHEKIVFNLNKAICAQAKVLHVLDRHVEAEQFLKDAQQLLEDHYSVFSTKNYKLAKQEQEQLLVLFRPQEKNGQKPTGLQFFDSRVTSQSETSVNKKEGFLFY
ncbi:FAD-dependent oxidoreductase [Legionella spiritensis]|uniref:Pyridine nucleotide-disulfide oxidoreductase n=1 Tax=Legionella spiritensis TaxID=452 RepID=A0A0W0Z8D1_LEGSP|nr:FAD-dependent oxidoreductase [Legionella spiritensis]KTD65371.1 Pyridine nucleotide-disulfide oxidoreductase [Legionella spiritensis]SNV47211.1 Pyridine nucleotide-disulphide oxidoreductase [Legionella spiritensis]